MAHLLWWAVPLVGLACVLIASYSALTHRRFPNANEPLSELLPGRSVGQTFVARYPNLSGVEVRLGTYGRGSQPSTSSLVLHLREAPGLPNLATARLPAGQIIGENPWYLFSFAPQAASQGKSYYIEIESPDAAPGTALTLFWWRALLGTDPVATGSAYLDGKPAKGDLAFGLRYSPSPVTAWLQVARAASVNFPLPLIALMALMALAGVVMAGWALRKRAYRTEARSSRARLPFSSLAAALLVGLAHGLLLMFAIPPWQAPDEYAHFAYVALLDRNGLDDAQVKSSFLAHGAQDRPLAETVNASMARHDFTRRVAGYTHPGLPTDTGPVLLQEVRQPATYYWISAAAMRTLRAIGLPLDPYTNPESALSVIRGVSVALSLLVIALAWLAGVLLSHRHHRAIDAAFSPDPAPLARLPLLLPLGVALLPMRAFTDSVANNDVLAELAVSALFVVLVALLRWPHTLYAVPLALLAGVLTAAGAATKATALAAALPLLALGLAAWLGMLASRTLERRGRYSQARLALPVALLLPVVALVGLFLALEPGGTAAGWEISREPVLRPPRVSSATAIDGEHVIELAGTPGSSAASQVLVPRMLHPGFDLTVTGWARLPESVPPEPTRQAGARLIVRAGNAEVGVGGAMFAAPGEWAPITVTAKIEESGEPVTLWLSAESDNRPVQFDGLSLRAEKLTRPWPGPIHTLGLLNGSAEVEALSLRPALAALLPTDVAQMAHVLPNPLAYNLQALWSDYALTMFRSFWGNFGWFSLPLPEPLYAILALATLVSLVGIAAHALARRRRWGAPEWLGLISLGALAGAIVVAFARQTTLSVVTGVPAYPQGRYLFVLVVPILWLLISTLLSLWASAWSLMRGLSEHSPRRSPGYPAQTSGAQPHEPFAWGAWLMLNALLSFAAYCLLALVAPYYYG